jgi:hypothetical protein
VRNCLIDEGRSLGTGWQEQVPPSAAGAKSQGREHRRKRPGKNQVR